MKKLFLIVAALVLACGLDCCRQKPTLKQWLDSMPDADTSQLLNPSRGAPMPAKKIKIGDESRDAWVLKPDDSLQAVAKCRDELRLSLGILSGDRKKPGKARVELEISSAGLKKNKVLMDVDYSQTASQWKEFRVVIDSVPETGCEIRLKFSTSPADPGETVFLAVADSHISTPETSPQKNIIIVNITTLRKDHCGIYGYKRASTAAIDRLALQSLIFTNTISASSFTVPSVASLFTSLYPSEHGATGKNEMVLPGKNVTLAEILEQNGYATAAFSASPLISPEFGFAQGFEKFTAPASQRANAVYTKAMPWLETHYRGQPFFLYLMFFDPNQPYDPTDGFEFMFQRDDSGRKIWPDSMLKQKPVHLSKLSPKISEIEMKFIYSMYDAEVACADHFMGMIFQKMVLLDLFKNTIVVITSDHGEEFIEHGGYGHSRTLYREILEVPFILYYPGITEPGKKLPDLVRTIDIMPTVLELAGIDPPENITGKSLGPLFLKPGGVAFVPAPAFSELRPFLNPGDYLKAITTPDHKLIDNQFSKKTELYDLKKDPGEKNDLSKTSPADLKIMRDEMEQIQKAFRKIEPVKIRRVDSGRQKLLRELGYIE